jgi:hypothetical protein
LSKSSILDRIGADLDISLLGAIMDLFYFFMIASIVAIILGTFFAFNVYESGVIAGRYNMSRTNNRHRKCVDIFLCNVAISVLFIELMLFVKRGAPFEINLLDTNLGLVHVVLIVVFSVSVITMRWFITGEDNNVLHRKISKVALGSYAFILITGTWLMARLLSQI